MRWWWLLACGAQGLPYPVSTSYGSLDPEGSAAWMVKYLGAVRIESNWTAECASVAWVEMPGSGYQFRFLATPDLAHANYSFADYVAYVDSLYGNLSEQSAATYNQFMDFHVGMIVDDMTPYYEAMRNDSVPFFMVGQYPAFFDVFVEIPYTGAILEITSQRLDVENATISDWDICQKSRRMLSSDDQVNWRKTTFAAPYPIEMELFSIKYLGAKHIEQGHPGVWVRGCAKIAWVEFEEEGPAGIPYQFHMVDGYSYPPYEGLDVPGFAKLQESQRDYSSDRWDEWTNNHLAMWVDDLAPYYDALKADNVSFIARTDGSTLSLVIDTTPMAGNVIALVSDVFPLALSDVKPFSFCNY